MTWDAAVQGVEFGARIVVLAAVVNAALVALTHWAVRRRHLSPFGPVSRTVRRLTDPLLLPIERRLVRAGRNPQDATLWLLGLTIGAGILFLSIVGGLAGWIGQLIFLADASPKAWLRWGVSTTTQVILIALIVRVIASWFGHGVYTRWLRPAYLLTDWLVNPIRRFLPAFGMIDLSPLVAYVVLLLLRGFLLALLL